MKNKPSFIMLNHVTNSLSKLLLSLIVLMTLIGCSTKEPTPEPEVLTQYEQLVKDYGTTYKHLTWFDLSEIKDIETIESITLLTEKNDIMNLINQYGDAWPFALELSKEEVESTFEYIVWLSKDLKINAGRTTTQDGIRSMSNDIDEDYAKFDRSAMKLIDESTDLPLSLYSEYYSIDFTGNTSSNDPISFASNESFFGIGDDNKDLIDFKDKDWYVRDYIMRFFINLKSIYINDSEPKFYFENE